MTERFRPFAAVYTLLIRDEQVFLMRRAGTGWMDGYYGLPAGHLEKEESIVGAASREALEETGVEIEESALKVVHVMHRVRIGERQYIDFFLLADSWEGEPHNAEPDKCDDAQWFALDALPENIIPSVRAGIESYRRGIIFQEFGWDGEA